MNDKPVKVQINQEQMNAVIKKYKKAKRYMRSNLYIIKMMDGTEDYISTLLKESNLN